MAQAIKYQTTTVDATKTVGELQAIVQKYGGTRFETRWDGKGRVEGIRFAVRTDLGEIPVNMTANVEKITGILITRTSMMRARAEEQAYRIAWRHLKDLTEQLLLATELGLRDVGAAFMADLEVWDDEAGHEITLREWVAKRATLNPGRRGLLLTAGNR